MLITDKQELKKYGAGHRVWQGIPGIEVTKKGRIFACCYSGGVWEQFGNFVVLLKSDDGVHFEDPVAVAYNGRESRCYDPTLWIDPLGRLWLIWSVMTDHAVYAAVCEEPDAEELVWGEEFLVGHDVMMNKPTVLSTGEWLFPIAVWGDGVRVLDQKYDTKQTEKLAYAYRTADQGNTFEKLGGVDMPRRNYDEHMILELQDGRLAMYVRTKYGIGVAYSEDRGLTWSEGEDSGIWGPDSRFHIRRLPSGRVLLINNLKPAEGNDRTNLAAMLSEDDGKTWKHQLLLDERLHVSYPDVALGEDGFIYVTYDRERGNRNSLEETYEKAREVLYARITEEDIMAGSLVSSQSKLKVVISKLGKLAEDAENPFDEIC